MTLRTLATPTRTVDDAAIVTRAFEALVAVLRHAESYYRYDACFQLGELGDRAALPALCAAVIEARPGRR